MQSKSTLIISWLVAALLLIVGSVGWAKFFGERDTSKKLRKRLEQTDVACEPTEPRAPRTDLRAPEVRTIIKKIPSLEACLTNPIVKRNIKKSAKKLANILSDEKVEEYKEEQKIRRSKRFHKRMERREATFVKAINAFNEKANLDEKTARKLHGVFEDTFDKNRKLRSKYEENKLTRKEYRQQRRENRREARRSVIELLGEEGALDLWNTYRDQRRKEREQSRQN